ncbi:MAG: arsenical pump rane protein [Actinomycetota bacterium]|nr:arsenical pump rane protein [Actinomycetota bacterium]
MKQNDLGIGRWLLGGGATAAGVAFVGAPQAARDSFDQAWPAFALVAGLIAIGHVANEEGLFTALGERAARVRGGASSLFVILMLIVCVVTVVLNLDTSVTFLTPVLIAAARGRRLDERRFLYGCVFMSNAASLLLPGANLTNVIVLRAQHVTGGRFAARMLPAWIAAVVATGVVTWVAFRSQEIRVVPDGERPPVPMGLGAWGAISAAVLVIAAPQPALPVFILGLVVVGVALARGNPEPSSAWSRRGRCRSVRPSRSGCWFGCTRSVMERTCTPPCLGFSVANRLPQHGLGAGLQQPSRSRVADFARPDTSGSAAGGSGRRTQHCSHRLPIGLPVVQSCERQRSTAIDKDLHLRRVAERADCDPSCTAGPQSDRPRLNQERLLRRR